MSENIKLTDLLVELELTDRARGLTEGTIAKNIKFLKMFFKYLETEQRVTMLTEVKAIHIRQFMVYKYSDGKLAESYINVFLRCIRAYFNFAVDEGYISQAENPTLRVKWMKEHQKQVKAWSNKDVKKMLDYTEKNVRDCRNRLTKDRGQRGLFVAERNRLMIMILADTGLRVGELTSLKNKHITPKEILVVKGKGKKDRVMYCSPLVHKQLLKYDRAKRAFFLSKKEITDGMTSDLESFVFISKEGKKLSVDMVERAVTDIALKSGCDPIVRSSPHTFRHFFTQSQLDNGANIYDLQRLLGHSSIKVTEVYLKSITTDTIIHRGLLNSPLMNLE